jgi:MFS family permease
MSTPIMLGLTPRFRAEQPPRARGSARATAVLSFGLVANLAALMTFAATLHEIAVDWSLNASESGWIGGIYFAGYAIAVPFMASATDRMDGRRLYVASALLGAVASFAFAAFAHSFAVAMILRFLGGVGLAGVHMPGLNLLMDRIDRSYQGRAAGIYTSSYAAGSAGSFLGSDSLSMRLTSMLGRGDERGAGRAWRVRTFAV